MSRRKLFTSTILMLFFLTAFFSAVSQNLEIQIDTIRISSIKKIETQEITMHEDGPVVALHVSIINKSDTSINLYPSRANYYLTFNYDGNNYKQELFPLAFMDSENIELNPNQSVQFYVSENIFYGTNIYSIKKVNYTNELLKSIPTINFIYKQRNLLLKSSIIKTVELADY